MKSLIPLSIAVLLLLSWQGFRSFETEHVVGSNAPPSQAAIEPSRMGIAETAEPDITPTTVREEVQIQEQVGRTVRLKVKARQGKFFASPPSAGVEIRAWLAQSWKDAEGNWIRERRDLGTMRTDADGVASLKTVVVPSEGQGEITHGEIHLETLTPGWQDPVQDGYYPFLGLHRDPSRDQTERDLILAPGASIRILVEGDHDRSRWREMGKWITIVDLDNGLPLTRFPLQRLPSAGTWRKGGVFGLKEPGRYRFHVQTPAGSGATPDLDLDPADGTQEFTIELEDAHSISGRFRIPEGFRPGSNHVLAVRLEDAEAPEPPCWLSLDPSSPAIAAESWLEPDGSFSIRGLRPGRYRLGYAASGPDPMPLMESADALFDRQRERTVWLPIPPVDAGSRGLELDLPHGFLEVEVRKQDGTPWPTEERFRPEAYLSFAPKHEDGRFAFFRSLDRNSGKLRIPAFPGIPHTLQVRAPGFRELRMEVASFEPGEIRSLEVTLVEEEAGFLTWTADTEDVSAKLFTMDRSREVGRRGRRAIRAEPGTYLAVFRGENYYSFGHGVVGKERTEYGREERVVEIMAGKTTHVELDLPPAGSLRIHLMASGQPDLKTYGEDSFPAVPHVAFDGRKLHRHRATFVMRKEGFGMPVALSHQAYTSGSSPSRLFRFEPGDTYVPLEVFEAGSYELEVRVPGFPRRFLDVEIKAREQTLLEIDLSETD